MAKMHTRIKRKRGLTTHLKHRRNSNSMIKINRPKTFNTKETANKWAAEHNLSPEQYSLKPAKRNKKFMVVVKEDEGKGHAYKKVV